MNEKRILVVDDDDAIRALLLTVLKRRGYQIDAAKNGGEALVRLERCRYALMLLDLMMPVASGYDVLSRLRSLAPEDRPVVIVLTAGIEPHELDANIVAGTIRKPFDIPLLIETITACLNAVTLQGQKEKCPPADTEPSQQKARPN
jgi:CheY-like chemotaxis protein